MNAVLPAPASALTDAERTRLEELEEVVAEGLEQFRQVGDALAEIRDRRLYRVGHATFADYVRKRWNLGQSRAYQLMDAAEVAREIQSSTIVEVYPANECQIRPLTLLPDAPTRLDVWERAIQAAGGLPPTGQQVAHVAARTLAGLDPEAQAAVIQGEGDAARAELARIEAEEHRAKFLKDLGKLEKSAREFPESVRGKVAMGLGQVRRVVEEI